MAGPRLPPYLTPELVEEILLRVSPEDPAILVRASLACKPWRRLLCDPAFRRRYLAFHRRTPPLLGFLHYRWRVARGEGADGVVVPGFVATTTPSPFPKQAFDGCAASWSVVDCRHGRVLFEASRDDVCLVLVVWEPATGKRKWLPKLPTRCSRYTVAVLCALHGHGCDHLECCGGAFFAVLVQSGVIGRSVRVHLYSSEAGSWSTSPDLLSGFVVDSNWSTIIGNDIYFVSTFGSWDQILRYSLGNNRICFLQAPAADKFLGHFFLVPMEDGSLGFGTIGATRRLCLWSRNVDPDVVAEAGWVHRRTIDIELCKSIPISVMYDVQVVGSADDFGIIFVATVDGVFTIDLKSSRAKKVGETMACFKIFPFMTFYTPDSRLS
ncbi:hypothetical protein BDA96_02G020800 [Sorghum bicolor]|uniref:F-box domain-containing protein n=1 Tax=Sorghum bicolor TaxID=4558 RepID=A0A921RKT5_SORBI|nr:uncharacterized protein LOC8059886 [Sorghum bicolor]KAG0541488.1 hypothetical protein BDA96_02G020800 [Sorghum bicolor]|eukprot:XP_002461381.2 uncharacterized protein LOC8059886 [Sorghum bicolor]